MILNIKPKDISSIITGSSGEDPKMLANFKDLLEKIFVLDPDKRMTVAQALTHPFITGKWTMLLNLWLRKCCSARYLYIDLIHFQFLITGHYPSSLWWPKNFNTVLAWLKSELGDVWSGVLFAGGFFRGLYCKAIVSIVRQLAEGVFSLVIILDYGHCENSFIYLFVL